MEEEKCRFCLYNPEVVELLQNELPNEETTSRLAEVFKVFGDNTRIRILWVLFDKELCVCDICEKLGMSQSAISHQLRVLKNARLVKARREERHTFYSLDDDHVKKIIEQVIIHIKE